MVYCIGIMDSGNYAYNLCRALERKGFVFEVVATPCQIAQMGCGYSLKFPEDYKELVLKEAKSSGYAIREIYRIIPMVTKNKYQKIL